jgi:hypothetical protein
MNTTCHLGGNYNLIRQCLFRLLFNCPVETVNIPKWNAADILNK